MTAQIAAYGRLVDDPQVKQTSKGTPMTLARMAVSLPCSQAQDGQATLWLSVMAFGKQADFWLNIKRRRCQRIRHDAGQPVDRTERGNAAGLSGYCRQRNQCPCGTSWREQTQNHRHTG